MRKSPYKHPVKSHIRSGRKVHNYIRGRGEKPTKLADPRISFKKPSPKPPTKFTVSIKYLKSRETFQVDASSHDNAIKIAMAKRKSIKSPKEVESVMN